MLRVVDVTPSSFIFELADTSEQIDAFAELMRPLGLVELARTGVAAMLRGARGDAMRLVLALGIVLALAACERQSGDPLLPTGAGEGAAAGRGLSPGSGPRPIRPTRGSPGPRPRPRIST